jgi:hypothetical protein
MAEGPRHPIHTVPYGTVYYLDTFQAVNCQDFDELSRALLSSRPSGTKARLGTCPHFRSHIICAAFMSQIILNCLLSYDVEWETDHPTMTLEKRSQAAICHLSPVICHC